MWLAYFLAFYLIILSIVFYTNYRGRIYESGYTVRRTNRDKAFLFLSFAPLLFLVCFRGVDVGSDTQNYYFYFELIQEHVLNAGIGATIATRLEPGFIFFIKVLCSFFDSPQSLLIASALFFYFSFIRFVYKYSRYPWLSTIMFFSLHFNGTMNVIRQYLAIGILLFAFDYVIMKRKKTFLLCVLIATMFHYTAIVFIVAYYFRNKKINISIIRKYYLLIPVVALVSLAFLTIFFNFIHSFGLYDYHDNDSKYIEGGVKLATLIMLFLSMLVVFVSCNAWGLLRKNSHINSDIVNLPLIWYSMIGVILIVISLPFSLLGRLGTFYTIFNCILLPNAVFQISRKRDARLLNIFLCLLYCSYYLVVNTIRPEWSCIYPYSFF